ncbi:glycosyltransferase [Hellea sp.]|nr:glycosyltransferase [Hellea sp.]
MIHSIDPEKHTDTLFEHGDPKVTIVIPVYNGSNYVEGAINSALNQTYDNVEVLVVNDGSNDEGATANICKAFGDEIVYVEQENQGVAGAMNTALAHMTGDLFCWLSHDDEHLPDKTQKQIDFLRDLGRGDIMLFGNYFLMDDHGKVWHESQMDKNLLMKTPSIALLRGMINGCTLMIPANILRKHLPFKTDLRFTQDYEMWDRLREDGEFLFMPETLVKYRIHPDQDTNNPKANIEGDKLWIWMMSRRSDTEKVLLNGSRKKYFTELEEFLSKTPYIAATEYAQDQASAIDDNALVSIVIPFYNEPELTCRAIKSALNQTYPNIEVVAVNDGSTADMKSVRDLVSKYENAKIIDIKNGGVGNARNVGMRASRGEYIAFLDSDDVFLPYKVSNQLTAMMNGGYLFSHTSYHVEYPNGRSGLGVVHSGTQHGDLYPDIIRSCAVSTPTVMFHRIFIAMGLQFPVASNLGEDIETWLWVAARYPILGIDEPLSVITWRDDSAALNLSKGIEGLTEIMKAVCKHPLHRKEKKAIKSLGTGLAELSKMRAVAASHPMAEKAERIVSLDTIRVAYGNAEMIKSKKKFGKPIVLEVGVNGEPNAVNPYIIQVSSR